MAKLKYLLDITEQSDDFEGDFDLSVAENGKTATWANTETGAEVDLVGKDLSAGEGDTLDDGKITAVTVVNGDGKTIVEITDLNLKATSLTAAFLEGGISGALELVTAGDDTVTGTKKSDYLYSGAGDDTLTGKAGSDTFVFQALEVERSNAKPAPEHDIITDFDTKGEDADILSVSQDIDTLKPLHNGHDVLVKFDDGSSLELEGVTKKEFQQYLSSLEF